MNILIAPDSFKESLTALQAAEAIARGLQSELPAACLRLVPMADGGEGTVAALTAAAGGTLVTAQTEDPLRRPLTAVYGLLHGGTTAVIETAAASGLERLLPEERDPRRTTTYGTGLLVKAALDRGCRRIILGLGGSATNDAGVGLARALGARFTSEHGDEGCGGGALGAIARIDLSGLDERIRQTEFLAACDVTNPLTGAKGASLVYGPQKGADRAMAEELDINLKRLAELIRGQLGQDVENIPGAGAAGGLGAGLIAFLGARLLPGFDIVRAETHFDAHVSRADLVITGEGRIDNQTQYGKTPFGVARVAQEHGKPVIALAGSLGEGYEQLYALGFSALFSVVDRPMILSEALDQAAGLVERSARAIARLLICTGFAQ